MHYLFFLSNCKTIPLVHTDYDVNSVIICGLFVVMRLILVVYTWHCFTAVNVTW
jgi:hypothetical protein